MNYDIVATPRFKRDIKKLSKKYPSIKHEFAILIATLEHSPEQGSPLGNHCFKIRLSIASKVKVNQAAQG
jgi:mRNA-degrading endonuclease RelE of RelBE toxin-antitoxin system